ncbi:MAG TPA: hypothetical protein VNQ99_00080 [Xanthobacteraceae bacterium]|nr:hypothetical protein [Xanthobacteraceae bacterium]
MEIKRFNWKPKPSAWQYAQAWKAQRANMVARFQDEAAAAASTFQNAQNNLSMGLATIAAEASAKRVQNDIAAKLGSVNKLV